MLALVSFLRSGFKRAMQTRASKGALNAGVHIWAMWTGFTDMGTVGADWDSDTEGPLQQAEHACVGNAFCRRRDPVSETQCVFYSSCQKHMKEEVRSGMHVI